MPSNGIASPLISNDTPAACATAANAVVATAATTLALTPVLHTGRVVVLLRVVVGAVVVVMQ